MSRRSRRTEFRGRRLVGPSSPHAGLPRDEFDVVRRSPPEYVDGDPSLGWLSTGVWGGTPYLHRQASVYVAPRRSKNPPTTERSFWAGDLVMRVPERVRFCVQRKTRREVLFAVRRAGYGGSAKKKFWRRTANSQYGC